MITLMASFDGNRVKIDEYANECKRLNIDVIPPSINFSSKTFSLYKKKILFGFNCIKGIGEETSKKIISIRENIPNKLFSNFSTTVKYLITNGIGEATIEILILANAFSIFGLSKKYLLTNLKEFISSSKNIKSDGKYLFEPNLKNVEETIEDHNILDEKEYDLLGVSFSNKPQKSNFKNLSEKLIKEYNIVNISELVSLNKDANIAAVIISIKKIKTKSMKDMAFIKVSDSSQTLEIVCFINKFLDKDFFDKDKIYILGLKYSTKNYQLMNVKEGLLYDEK